MPSAASAWSCDEVLVAAHDEGGDASPVGFGEGFEQQRVRLVQEDRIDRGQVDEPSRHGWERRLRSWPLDTTSTSRSA
ncbi:hypothetical protein ACIGQE_27560 [Streptomyces sp. NPDC053429]|uniref:hypothetical protein n=1 Tax=Streptomyces sp. NPDC053429 TaxID=3365702 RepID=UPI0037D3C5C5